MTRLLTSSSDVRLREHEAREVELTNDEVALLRREFKGQLDVLPTTAPSIHVLDPCQYVGFILLPTARLIEIRPKVTIGVLFAMLAKAHGLADFEPDPAGHATVTGLFEFVVEIFTSQVEDLVARGILRSFNECRDELRAPRGKILVTETIRCRPAVRDQHWCQFTEFTPDIIENRILELTCQTLMPFPYRKIPGLSTRLRRLLRALADVTLDPNAADSFDELVYHRLNEHYRPTLSVARMLLAHLSPSGVRGKSQFLAFLVDMNKLFEDYLTAILRERLAASELSLIAQDQSHRLDLDRQLPVKPDVVIYCDASPCLAIDAKYRTKGPGSDAYQALAYCHALGIPKALLVYPASENVAPARHRIRPAGEIEVRTQTLDLSGDLGALRQEAALFGDRVWHQANRASVGRTEDGEP